jgi:hypothetical protein
MNTFDALNLIALKGATKPDAESNLRFVTRWYSKTFHTPLHVVANDVPIEDIWLAFFEERYHGMPPEELQTYVSMALETPEERRARIDAEENEAAADEAFARQAEAAAKAKPVPIVPVHNPAELLSQVPSLPETTLPVVEPDVEITFQEVDPEEMAALLEGSSGPVKKVDPASFR